MTIGPRMACSGALVALILGGCAVRDSTAPGLPPPPQAVFGDYNPGPWAIFYDRGSDRPIDGTRDAIAQIADMVERLPAIGVSLCPAVALDVIEPPRLVRQRMKALRALLRRNGVQRIVTGANCLTLERRALPMIWVAPDVRLASLSGA